MFTSISSMADITSLKGFINLIKQLAVQAAVERQLLKEILDFLEGQSIIVWFKEKQFRTMVGAENGRDSMPNGSLKDDNKEALVTETKILTWKDVLVMPKAEKKEELVTENEILTWKDVLVLPKKSSKENIKDVKGMAKKFEEVVKIKNDEKREEEVKEDAKEIVEDSFDLEQEKYEAWIKDILSDQDGSRETGLFAKALKLKRIYKAMLEKFVDSLLGYNGMAHEFKKLKEELERYILENKDINGHFIVQLISVLVNADGKVDDMENVTKEVTAHPAACNIISTFRQYALLLDLTVRMLYQQVEKEKGLHELHGCITAAIKDRE